MDFRKTMNMFSSKGTTKRMKNPVTGGEERSMRHIALCSIQKGQINEKAENTLLKTGRRTGKALHGRGSPDSKEPVRTRSPPFITGITK